LIPLAAIERAGETIQGAAVRTPLVRLPDTGIWLKLECLQPAGALRPGARVTVEPETAAPLARSLPAGEPQEAPSERSFVDGAGAPAVLPRMWPLLSQLVDAALTATLAETAAAVRLLAERLHVVVEGAGALALAAALAGRAGRGTIVSVVSGGNVDLPVLARLLAGEAP